MLEKQVHSLLVVHGERLLIGMISLNDLACEAAQQVEIGLRGRWPNRTANQRCDGRCCALRATRYRRSKGRVTPTGIKRDATSTKK